MAELPIQRARLLKGGLITIPITIRRQLGWKGGTKVEIVELDDGILLKPLDNTPDTLQPGQ